MKLGRLVNGVDTYPVTGRRLLEVLVRDGLDGGNAEQHLIVILTQRHDLVKGLRLDVKLTAEHIQLPGRIHHQIGIRQVHELLVTPVPVTRHTDTVGDGVCLQDHPIEVVVPLLDVLQNRQCIIQLLGQHIVLRFHPRILHTEFLLGRRAQEKKQGQEASGSQAHTDKKLTSNAENTLSDSGINPIVSAGSRVIDIIDFAHAFLQTT